MTDISPPPRHPLRILLVDDHAEFRAGIRQLLGCEPDIELVGEAADGSQAIQLARALRPAQLDLVLMDIDLPGLDGIEATQRIADTDPDLPIVMLTISTLDRDLFDAIRVGAIGFLSKGLSPEALVRALRAFHRDESLPMSRATATKVLAYFQGRDPNTSPGANIEGTLTSREREVLELVARGSRDREIAQTLVVSEGTVKKHVQNILRKLHARNRAEAVAHLKGHHFGLG